MHHCAALTPQNNKPTDMSRIEAKSASIIGPVVSSESTRLLRSAQHPNSRLDQAWQHLVGFSDAASPKGMVVDRDHVDPARIATFPADSNSNGDRAEQAGASNNCPRHV